MSALSYFTLTNSNNTLSKRFKVIFGTYKPIKEKAQAIRKTLEGKYDISQGGIYQRHEYVVRVREESLDPDYGTIYDLETFFGYNNPNGDPSSRLTLTTHWGEEWIVEMAGDFTPDPLGVLLEGPDASYVIRVVFLFLEAGGS